MMGLGPLIHSGLNFEVFFWMRFSLGVLLCDKRVFGDKFFYSVCGEYGDASLDQFILK